MKQMKFFNARNSLLHANRLCKDPIDGYLFSFIKHLGNYVPDTVDSLDLVMFVHLMKCDIESGHNSFEPNNPKLPNELIKWKDQILKNINNFPQIVDQIATPEFSEAFRNEWFAFFKAIPPKKNYA